MDDTDIPAHIRSIRELDLSRDLLTEPLSGSWFRLGAWTGAAQRDAGGVEGVVERQTLLIAPGDFFHLFYHLDSVGNVLSGVGKPGGSIIENDAPGEADRYRYFASHQFQIPFTYTTAEPLVWVRDAATGAQFVINPDLWLFFELEERAAGKGIWSDPRRGIDVVVRRTLDEDNLEVVDIRVDYLRKYLQARQRALLVGHYRHLLLHDPSEAAVGAFVDEDVTLGAPDQGVKAYMQNWGPRQDIPGEGTFLQRRLHLWYQIAPAPIDIRDPWREEPPFDPYTFVFPTAAGPVAPARWTDVAEDPDRAFVGECDYMTRIWFQQDVLSKYEGASGFDVADNGSVSCRHYWGLVRSTSRLGNELLATAIGDFAQGVPFEEWPHWRQYAVPPPTQETADALRQEGTVPDAVSSLADTLQGLNVALASLSQSLGIESPQPLWRGSLDSLAGRQMKWVYPDAADDEEFLKRATLASTLVIESLTPKAIRSVLATMGAGLHMASAAPDRPLGSRNLLQRLVLICALIWNLRPSIGAIPAMVREAEGMTEDAYEPDLRAELRDRYAQVQRMFAPMAFLYDLRTHGGIAHAPNMGGVSTAARELGLPTRGWHRTDYLGLLARVQGSVEAMAAHLVSAAQTVVDGLPTDDG